MTNPEAPETTAIETPSRKRMISSLSPSIRAGTSGSDTAGRSLHHLERLTRGRLIAGIFFRATFGVRRAYLEFTHARKTWHRASLRLVAASAPRC